MTGWRLGYAAVPAELVDPLTRLIVNSTSCVPPFAQLAGVAALEGPQDAVVEMVAEFRRRRDFLVPALNTIPGVRCIEPGGAFYAFPNVSELPIGADELADRLLDEAGVAAALGHLVRPPRRRPSPHLVRLVAREPRAGGRAHPRLRRRAVGRPPAAGRSLGSMHARLRRRPLARCPCRRRRRRHDRGGPRALPPRLRGRHRDPVRDAARACPLGPLPADGRSATALYAESLAEMRSEVAAWGLDLRRGWEVYPSEIAGNDPADLVLDGTRAVLIEFPGLVARHRGSDRRGRRRRPSWSRRRGSCRCSPTRSVAAPSPPIPRACARSPSGAGSCASTHRRSSAGTARPPSAPSWALLDAGLVAHRRLRRPLGRAAADPRRRVPAWCASAAATRSRGRCSTAARFPGRRG